LLDFSFWRYHHYHQRPVQSSYLHFGKIKIFLGGYVSVEFVCELQITTWRRKMEGLSLEFFFPLYLSLPGGFCYMLHSTFNSTVPFGPSAFPMPNNAVRYTDLQFKTSVTPQILQYTSITQNHSNIHMKLIYLSLKSLLRIWVLHQTLCVI